MLEKRGITSKRIKERRKNEFLFNLKNNRPLSYTTCVTIFKKAAKKAGLTGNYTCICFRKGGNQTLMEQRVLELLMMKKGRWKSKVVRCYGSETKEMKIIMSNMMNPRPSQETKLRMRLLRALQPRN